MSFIQPLFLAGLLAAALPLLIHLINRKKAVVRPFPALKLLRESNERIARSVKIRQWLLLALRVLAIAVLALALAKPYVLSSTGITADERLPTSVVFVVENGLAMENADWWEQAKEQLNDEIRGLRPWDEAALVTTSDDEPIIRDLTGEHGDLRRAADDLQLRYQTGDLGSALISADSILGTSELPGRRIVVVGSNTDSAVEPHRELNLSNPVDYVSFRSDEAAENLAISSVDYEQRGAARDGRWRVDAVVENFGHSVQNGVTLRLRVDDTVVAGETIDVPAGESISHSFDHTVEEARLAEAVVEIADARGLESDTHWHFLLHPQHRVRTLLVNGSPSTVPYNDELFFLTRALESTAGSSAGIVPSITTPDGLDRRNFDDFDAIVLANVSRLTSEQADDLKSYVERGGGLFITMGDQVDEEAYNQLLGDLLPRPLRGEKRLAERDDPDAPVKTTRMGHPQRQHPIFQSFDVPGSGALQSVSVYSYMLLDPAPSDRNSELILAYQDNAPALLERRVGQGRVLLFTSSVDRDWTDFPVRTAYLPLINRSLLYLARRATSGSDELRIVGDQVRFEVGDLINERAIIHDPDGRRIVLEPTDGVVSFVPRTPGMHSFFADDDGDDSGHLIESMTFAANVDRSGSELGSFPHALLDDWQGEQEIDGEMTDGPGDERRLNLWSFFLFVVTLALLLETVLGARRSVLVRTLDKLAFWRRS